MKGGDPTTPETEVRSSTLWEERGQFPVLAWEDKWGSDGSLWGLFEQRVASQRGRASFFTSLKVAATAESRERGVAGKRGRRATVQGPRPRSLVVGQGASLPD